MEGRDFTFRSESQGFYWEGPGFRGHFKLPGFPDYQVLNTALAVAGIQQLKTYGVQSHFQTIQKSLFDTHWPARMEEISANPLVVMDGAHNPEAARALLGSLKARYPQRKWLVLNGFLGDKDYWNYIQILRPLTALSIVTEPESERAETAVNVFKAWEKAGAKTLAIKNWKKALNFSRAKLVQSRKWGLLITGSLYLVGSCRRILKGLEGLEGV
jgi:dihydrofolate synthase/folylpolyglutamate synthase